MPEGPAKVRQLVDWSSAIWAGLIAGTIFLLLNLFVVTPAVLGGNGWGFIRLLASITLGEGVLAPPATFDAASLTAGLATHYLLSTLYALLLAIMIHRWGVVVGLAVGALFGAAIYGINVLTFTLVFPWFMTVAGGAFLWTHVIFGAAAGGLYETLEVEEFVPIDAPRVAADSAENVS